MCRRAGFVCCGILIMCEGRFQLNRSKSACSRDNVSRIALSNLRAQQDCSNNQR